MKHSFYGCENELERNYFARVSYFTHQKPVAFSPKFCHFFSEKFEELFVSTTGIKPSRKIGILMPNRDDSRQLYEPGLVSRLNPVLWIMPDYFDDISFCWQSKTGNMVKPTDEEFDLSDLECWLEGLKPVEYWKQVATEKNIHPFKISNLPFELKVFGFGVNTMVFRIYNRWGQLMFESNNPRIGWNGVFKGKPQPMDAYAYTLEAELIDGEKVKQAGNITLVR